MNFTQFGVMEQCFVMLAIVNVYVRMIIIGLWVSQKLIEFGQMTRTLFLPYWLTK